MRDDNDISYKAANFKPSIKRREINPRETEKSSKIKRVTAILDLRRDSSSRFGSQNVLPWSRKGSFSPPL